MGKEAIKGIIFDWGGVLIDNPQQVFVSYCAQVFDVPEDNFVWALNKHQPEFRAGLVSEKVFWGKMAKELQINMDREESVWSGAFRAGHSPRPEMFSLVAALKNQKYRIGLLSDTEMPAVEFFNKQKYKKLFNATVFSCLEGMVKPNEKIYLLALKRLGLSARETVFIDDNVEYAVAAQDVGMHSIHFANPRQVKQELRSLAVKGV